jgi:hypothetical protein
VGPQKPHAQCVDKAHHQRGETNGGIAFFMDGHDSKFWFLPGSFSFPTSLARAANICTTYEFDLFKEKIPTPRIL